LQSDFPLFYLKNKVKMTKELDVLSYRRRHRGIIDVKSKMPIKGLSVLSRIYTPGVRGALQGN